LSYLRNFYRSEIRFRFGFRQAPQNQRSVHIAPGAAQGVVLVSLPIFVLWSWCDLANAWLTVTRFTNVHFMSYLKCWNCCWTWNLCFLLIFQLKKKLQLKFAFWDTFKLLRCLNPRNWTIALGVIPRGHKYAQKPRNGSELTPVSEMGHSL